MRSRDLHRVEARGICSLGDRREVDDTWELASGGKRDCEMEGPPDAPPFYFLIKKFVGAFCGQKEWREFCNLL